MSWTGADGRRHSRTSRDRDELVRFRAELEAALPAQAACSQRVPVEPEADEIAPPPSAAARRRVVALVDGFDGSARAFRDLIANTVAVLTEAQADGDLPAIRLLRQYIPALRDLSSAIAPHAGYVALEEEHAKLVKWVEDLYAGKVTLADDAAKPHLARSPVATLAGRAGPGAEGN